jgi:Flagellar hook-length control protein FliK
MQIPYRKARNEILTALKLTSENDTLQPVAHGPARSRHGNDRHIGKELKIFPAVLDTVSAAKSFEADSVVADINLDVKDSPVEESEAADDKMVVTIPVDGLKQYLQDFVPFTPAPVAANVPAAPLNPDMTLLAALITRINMGGPPQVHEKKAASNAVELPGGVCVDWDDGRSDSQDVPMVSTDNPVPAINLHELEVVDQATYVASPPGDAKVIRVETSFTPVGASSVMIQVSKAIADGLEPSYPRPVSAIQNVVVDPRPEIVRSLELQLHPDDLGKIKVAMRLRGSELSLKIEVTSKQVETLLLRDHNALKEIMGHAGYDITDAAISIAVSVHDVNTPLRNAPPQDPSQGSFAGQGGRHYPTSNGDNRNQSQTTRGSHASEFDGDDTTQRPAVGSRDTGRGNGVYI